MNIFLAGKTLSHTLSPTINGLFGFLYEAREFGDVSEIEPVLKRDDFCACNVTIPYKTAVMQYLDEIDDVAREIQAVNTVIKKNGKICGYTTDVPALEYALNRANICVKDKICMILGTGGTSKVARFVLARGGAKKIVVVGRHSEVNYDNYFLQKDVQVLINTSPVGMYPNVDEVKVDLGRLPCLEAVFDAIYNPLKTRLIYEAEKLNIKAENGLSMLIRQAELAGRIFMMSDNKPSRISAKFDINSEIGHTDDKVHQSATMLCNKHLLENKQNIVFVGMPGVGKTTIAKAYADGHNKTFVDTDALIEERAQTSISQIFESQGEEYFRSVEREVTRTTLSRQGQVVATGGGIVLDEHNRYMLSANGIVVWLRRDIDTLATNGRPLSKSPDALRAMYDQRKPLYQSVSDIVIDVGEDIDLTVDKIDAQIKHLTVTKHTIGD